MDIASLLTGQGLIFGVLALGALASAILVLLTANPLRSALFLVLNLFCIAGLYLTLNAYFLATVQVIVYAGAIMVLFLFVIMLLNLGAPDRSADRMRWQAPLAAAAGLVLAGILGTVLLRGVPSLPAVSENGPSGVPMGSVQGIGKELYDPSHPWLFPFEVTSVLLLIAVIGSVVLARKATGGAR